MPIGTITNVAAVIAGAAIGALAGPRLPGNLRASVVTTLGLLTAALGFRETLATNEFAWVLGAVLIGTVIGEILGIERALHRFGEDLQQRFGGHPEDPDLDIDAPETAVPRPHDTRFSEGFVIASLVFCIGPLTIVGSIEDGLGDPELLLVKAALDGFAAIAFASAYGWGVSLAALTVIAVQGPIALGAGMMEDTLTDPMLDALGAAGGILLIGISLRLLDLKQVRVANMLPAVALAPAFVAWFA